MILYRSARFSMILSTHFSRVPHVLWHVHPSSGVSASTVCLGVLRLPCFGISSSCSFSIGHGQSIWSRTWASGGVIAMDPFLKKFFPSVYWKTKEPSLISNYCKYDNQGLHLFKSSLYLAGLTATFFASYTSRRLGWRLTMLIAGVFFIVGVILNATAMNLVMLIIGRILLGCGVGFANQVFFFVIKNTTTLHRFEYLSSFLPNFRAMASSSSSSSNFSKSFKSTTLTCHCGYPAPIRVSWTKENPRRRFAGCRNFKVRPCNFFKWINDDDLKTYKAIMYELHCKYKDLQRKHDDLNNMVETEKNNYKKNGQL
ncbi:hypothetical protein LguiA_030890 [Lonicera macranthoides]